MLQMGVGEGWRGEGKDLMYSYWWVTEVKQLKGKLENSIYSTPIVWIFTDLQHHDLRDESIYREKDEYSEGSGEEKQEGECGREGRPQDHHWQSLIWAQTRG